MIALSGLRLTGCAGSSNTTNPPVYYNRAAAGRMCLSRVAAMSWWTEPHDGHGCATKYNVTILGYTAAAPAPQEISWARRSM